ncbi:MAG: hypothetical protein ACON35_01210 [Candidatus Marinamargulisbacteria bacterium]
MKKTIAIQNRAILKPSSREVAIKEIQNSGIRDELKEQFIKIAQNDTGENINLVNKDIGIKEAVYLAKALRENISLKKINLSCNPLQPEGVCYLAEALKINTSLQEIDLSSNKIKDKGVIALVKAFKANTSLKTIDLSWGGITAEGVKEIAELLEENTTLEKIDLMFNFYPEKKKYDDLIKSKILRNMALNTILKGSLEEIEEVIGEVQSATAKLWILEKVEKALEAYFKNIHINVFSLKFECLKFISDAEDVGTLIEQVGFTSKKEAEELTNQIIRYEKVKALARLEMLKQGEQL